MSHRSFFRRLQLPRMLPVVLILTFSLSFQASSEPTPGPALWRVEGGRADMWFFGTFHLLPKGHEWQNQTIDQAFSRSKTVVMEAVEPNGVTRERIFRRYALNEKDVTLRDWLTREEVVEVEQALAKLDISFESVQPFKPWFVALLIASTSVERLGFGDEHGVDKILTQQARDDEKKIIFLDSADDTVKAMAQHPGDVQVRMLLTTIEDSEDIGENVSRMLKHWQSGNVEATAKILNSGLTSIPEIAETILYERNRRWARRLDKMLKRRGRYFVALGSAHMAGKENLIELLAARGYRVVRQ